MTRKKIRRVEICIITLQVNSHHISTVLSRTPNLSAKQWRQ